MKNKNYPKKMWFGWANQCSKCNVILSSASEKEILPPYDYCECEEEKNINQNDNHTTTKTKNK